MSANYDDPKKGIPKMKIVLIAVISCCLSLMANESKGFDLSHKIHEMSLDAYLAYYHQNVIEGHVYMWKTTQPQFFEDLIRSHPDIHTVGEIGFNAGHSSELFLKQRGDIEVYSFDIMDHSYTAYSKEYIDIKYPNRHRLIEGNSVETVPLFFSSNDHLQLDLIFIDGGHDYEVVYNDINNMSAFAHFDTILIIDDMGYESVRQARLELIKENVITEGRTIKSKNKSWVQCKYIK